jgi:hypothetical protein
LVKIVFLFARTLPLARFDAIRPSMVRIDLAGADTASALGLTVQGRIPVLSLCRQLVAAGRDPAEPAEAYRGTTLALRIRSLGEAAGLTVVENQTLAPRFAKFRPFAPARVGRTGDELDWPLPLSPRA